MSYELTDDGSKMIANGREFAVADLEAVERLSREGNLESLLDYYSILKNYTVEYADVRDLVGRDLSGCLVRAWLANWEDSQWEYTDCLQTFKAVGDGFEAVPIESMAKLLEVAETGEGDFDELVNSIEGSGPQYTDLSFFYLNFDVIYSVEVLTPRAAN